MTLTEDQINEAAQELRRRKCRDSGHDMEFGPRHMADEVPMTVVCVRCGWQGTITMGPKP